MRELETERLRLRKLCETDAESMYNNWTSNPNVAKYVTWQTHEKSDSRLNFTDEFGRTVI